MSFRYAGVLLLTVSLAPIYLLLRDPRTGLAGSATVDIASAAGSMLWAGTMLAAAVGLIAARRLSPERADNAMARARGALLSVSGRGFAVSVALLGAVAALTVQHVIFRSQPVLIDAIAQIVNARYLAAGHLTAPADTVGFFRMQQTVPAAGGWTSQYPPLHVFVLALFAKLHAVRLAGPFAHGVALYFTARGMDRLMPRSAAARAGLLLGAVSPFMLAHAATYMSHATAAAAIALALHAYSRAVTSHDTVRWWLLCGVAIGAAFATRPLSGLTVGIVFATACLLHRASGRVRILLMLALGALPFAILTAAYNAALFGSATRFGYSVALGPHAGLGLGIDPWGNAYGVREAFAYTSAELTVLSLQLFEAPIWMVPIVALYLVVRPRLERGHAIVCALVLAPLAANLLYWHHGLFMGPRMLDEYGLLWSVAAVCAISGLIRIAPAQGSAALRAWSPRSFVAAGAAAVFAAMLVLIPQRLQSYAVPQSHAAMQASAAPPGSVVFVHGGWGERVSMQLAARGWRLDEVEAALRQNSTCSVQRVLDGELRRNQLDLRPRADGLPRRVEFPPGNPIRVVAGEPWTAECARQVRADSAGVIDPSALMWSGGLPGISRNAAVIARDLGPHLDAQLVANHPGARVLMRGTNGEPVLVSYDDGMRALWKEAVE